MIFTTFSDYWADYPNNKFVVVKETTDEIFGWTHKKYQQTYLDKPVEGAEFIEHINLDGYVEFINGKVVNDMEGDPWESTISEETAFNFLMDSFEEDHVYAWEDENGKQKSKLKQGIQLPLISLKAN